jgi:transcriptional regulator with XRE-family HTH domain
MRTVDYVDRLRAQLGLTSDYQVAKLLGVKSQHVSGWRRGVTLSDATALRVAELLQIDPAGVLADMAAERSGDDQVREVWERVARLVAGQLAAVLVAILAAASGDANARQINGLGGGGEQWRDAHYSDRRRRRRLSDSGSRCIPGVNPA